MNKLAIRIGVETPARPNRCINELRERDGVIVEGHINGAPLNRYCFVLSNEDWLPSKMSGPLLQLMGSLCGWRWLAVADVTRNLRAGRVMRKGILERTGWQCLSKDDIIICTRVVASPDEIKVAADSNMLLDSNSVLLISGDPVGSPEDGIDLLLPTLVKWRGSFSPALGCGAYEFLKRTGRSLIYWRGTDSGLRAGLIFITPGHFDVSSLCSSLDAEIFEGDRAFEAWL
jgi:hypothetical protein